MMRPNLIACLAALAAAAALLFTGPSARAEIVTRAVEYRHGDLLLEGYLAYDSAAQGDRPGVLVVHEWWGLNDYAKRRARELAEMGYVAFVADMFGKGVSASTAPEAQRLVAPLYGDFTLMRARATAGLETLKAQPNVDTQRLGAIGYCFGGSVVLELARSGADLDIVVPFHGGLRTTLPAERGGVKARVLAMNGAEDPMVPHEERQGFMKEMTEAGVDWQLVEFGGAVHSFTNPNAGRAGIPGVAYHEPSDKRSWKMMAQAFEEAFRR